MPICQTTHVVSRESDPVFSQPHPRRLVPVKAPRTGHEQLLPVLLDEDLLGREVSQVEEVIPHSAAPPLERAPMTIVDGVGVLPARAAWAQGGRARMARCACATWRISSGGTSRSPMKRVTRNPLSHRSPITSGAPPTPAATGPLAQAGIRERMSSTGWVMGELPRASGFTAATPRRDGPSRKQYRKTR